MDLISLSLSFPAVALQEGFNQGALVVEIDLWITKDDQVKLRHRVTGDSGV